jgi:predicted AAA+ superfamily ATPase
LGILWEHYVLNEIQARLRLRSIHYWRDKRGHEIDFIIPRRGKTTAPVAVECKWKADQFDSRNLEAFIYQYPEARFFVVAADVDKSYSRKYAETRVTFLSLPGLVKSLAGAAAFPRTDD